MITLQIINDFDNQIKLSNSLIEEIVSNVISSESKYINIDMSIIVCNDEYLRNLKIKYFDMDILTDVITFNLSEDEKDLEAEIYISWDRVDDNTKIYDDLIKSEDYLTLEDFENLESPHLIALMYPIKEKLMSKINDIITKTNSFLYTPWQI